MPRRILYVAPLVGGESSLYRYPSLLRLKQDVVPFNLAEYSFRWDKLNALQYRLPVGPLIARVNAGLVDAVHTAKPDVVWFDKPLVFTVPTLSRIKETGALTVCYNQDNPFGPRNDGCWLQFYRIHPLLDLHCVFRKTDVERYQGWGKNFILRFGTAVSAASRMVRWRPHPRSLVHWKPVRGKARVSAQADPRAQASRNHLRAEMESGSD
jgi:hypothetical protein